MCAGVFSNAASAAAKAKLRLLYECAPIALLVEAAGLFLFPILSFGEYFLSFGEFFLSFR